MPTLTPENALFGHTSEETAYVVEDYPYGFRLRCKIRYWIETTKNGDRFVSQTTNPKVAGERWNKPKKSTYTPIAVMYLDEQGHVTHGSLSSWSNEDQIIEFERNFLANLSDAQKRQLAIIKAIKKVGKTVTVSIHEGAMSAEEKAEQEQIKSQINQAVRVQAGREMKNL